MWCFKGYKMLTFVNLLLPLIITKATAELQFSQNFVNMKVLTNVTLNLKTSDTCDSNFAIEVLNKNDDIIKIFPTYFRQVGNESDSLNITLRAISAGKSQITVNTSSSLPTAETFVNVFVYKNQIVSVVAEITGWLYFLVWSITYYPQIYTNCRRKSVVGLNFDFVIFNTLGHLYYTFFNIGLLYVPCVKKDYVKRHPRSVIPVVVCDLVFSANSTVTTFIIMIQCIICQNGNQRVSIAAYVIISVYFTLTATFIPLVYFNITQWLDFLYLCSFVKLTLTLKYVPQAYMNYQRKSTEGWCIWNVVLDLAGGAFSILQMLLNAYNYDGWLFVIENPTKFFVGILTISFDVLFMYQHYFLYNSIGSLSSLCSDSKAHYDVKTNQQQTQTNGIN